MSLSKLNKFLDKPVIAPEVLNSTPILVTSSKGFSLCRNLDLITKFGFNIDVNCWAGANFLQTWDWLNNNLANKVQQYGNITLYIWIGTCDLTTKRGKFIQLAQSTDIQCENYIHSQVDRIVTFVKSHPSVRLIFLEIPPYSIKVWNSYKGHHSPESFEEQDKILEGRINLLNNYIKEVDAQSDVKSLNFKADLLKYQRVGRKPVINFKLFKDGVHPDRVLARVWMKRLVTKVFHDCL